MPIISDTGGMYEYQCFRILERKGHKKRTRGVRHAVLEGYDTLSKTSVRYKESLCEALQKNISLLYRTHVNTTCIGKVLHFHSNLHLQVYKIDCNRHHKRNACQSFFYFATPSLNRGFTSSWMPLNNKNKLVYFVLSWVFTTFAL